MSGQALSRTSQAGFLSSPGFSQAETPDSLLSLPDLACIYFKEYLPYVKKYVFLVVCYELLSGAINEKDSTDYRGKCRVWRGMCP